LNSYMSYRYKNIDKIHVTKIPTFKTLGPLLGPGHIEHNLGRGPPKEIFFAKVWSKLTERFQRRRRKCKKFTDDGCKVKTIAHMHLRSR